MLKTLKPRIRTLDTRIASAASTERIRGSALQSIRAEHFNRLPLCAHCLALVPPRFVKAIQLDHIRPLWEGGTDTPANRQGLCIPCHDAKTKAEAARRARGGE